MNTSCHYMVKKLDQQSCAKFDTFNIKGGGADRRTTKNDIKCYTLAKTELVYPKNVYLK